MTEHDHWSEQREREGAERARRWWDAGPGPEEWSDRRRLGIERRREWVRRRLEEPVNLPIEMERALEEHRDRFTPRQVEALTYRYGFGLSFTEAAGVLGVNRSTFVRRVRRAEANLERFGVWGLDHRDPLWEHEREERRAEHEAERMIWRRHGGQPTA